MLKLQGPPADVLTPHHLTLDSRFVAWSASWRPSFPKFQLDTKHTIPQKCLNLNVIAAPHIPPWLIHRAHFDLSMTYLPHLQNPHITATTVLSHLHDHYSDFVQVYTDGSKTAHRTGGGIYIPQYDIKKTIEKNRHSSVLISELYAILSALYWLTRSNLRGALIISDSLSAINSIRHATWKKHALLNKIICLNHVLLHRGTRIVYLWIPARRDVPGNDTADALARLSTIHGPSLTDVVYKKALNKLSLSWSTSSISNHCWQLWNDQYTASNEANTTNYFSQISTKHYNTPSLLRSSVCVLATANSTDISTNSDYVWTVTVIRVALRKLLNTFWFIAPNSTDKGQNSKATSAPCK